MIREVRFHKQGKHRVSCETVVWQTVTSWDVDPVCKSAVELVFPADHLAGTHDQWLCREECFFFNLEAPISMWM